MSQAVSAPSDRIGTLLREVGIEPTVERAREKSEELVRALVALYGDGLARMLEIVHEVAQERSEAIFAALCEDRFVENLLSLHDLHPLALEDRVRAALDAIRPYLESHDGDVEVVRVEEGIAYVRMAGSCDGCQSSALTLKHAVETAILQRIPEIAEVRAEGVTAIVAGRPSLRLQSEWVALDALPELASEGVAHLRCSGEPVLLARHGETLYAYRDRCPSCTCELAGATLAWPLVRCARCGARFDVVRAGRSVDDDGRFAEPFPLVREESRVRVAIPLGV